MNKTSIRKLINSLKERFGEKNVLTEPEHLYVYSHTGEFGFKKQVNPIAVLRIKPDTLWVLENLVEETSIPFAKIDELKEKPEQPFILVDVQKPMDIEDLLISLDELDREYKERKRNLKTVNSLHHWFNTRMQGMDGFRVEEDEGFCVVQSYFNGVQTYSSKGRLTLVRGLLKGEISNSPLLTDSIFSCTMCGQCYDQYSSSTFEINKALLKARKEIVEDAGVPKQFKKALGNITVNGNPQGLEKEDRTIWFEKQAEKNAMNDNSILYWAGCTTSYRLPEVVEATTSVLDKLGLDFGLLGENEGCCGLILYLAGQWSEAKENAVKVIEMIGDAETVVTGCAGCYYMFSHVYEELSLKVPFKVLHTSQLLDKSLGGIELKPFNGDYMWHDPCDLGRHSGVYQPPRNVLRRIPELNLIEHQLTKDHTVCCGAGGGLWTYKEELTNHVSHQKIMETIPDGIDGVITGCPTCLVSLRNTAKVYRPELRILDLAEVVDLSHKHRVRM